MTPFTVTTTKTFTPVWVKSAYSTYNLKWRAVRDTMSYKANTCFKCGGKFTEGESIALASFKEIGNKVMCEACAREISYTPC